MELEYAQELVQLVEKARKVSLQHEKKTQELSEREALTAKKESDLNMRQSSLNAREAQIVPIENMIQFKKDIQGTLDKCHTEREALEAEKKKWATQVQADKGQIEQDRITSKREADNNQKGVNNIEVLAVKRVKEILIQFGHADLAEKL